MVDRPALSYGLFHAQVKPRKLYGIVTTGIRFQGLNMDIGHLRSIRWVKDDNPQSAINAKPELTHNGKSAAQNRWIAYNKLRGQYNSAMEHAVPEQFWVDKSQCRYENEQGQIQNPTQADCAQAVSAVKAIAIAQAEGQRIYTIDQSNAATALPKLSVGGTVGQEIRSAIEAGKEVTFHERGINAHGFSGYGYVITDPETGGGAYLIEGRGNGAILLITLALVSFAFPPLWFVMAVGVASVATYASLAVLCIAMIVGVVGYINTLNKILNQENLTQGEKEGVMQTISALVILANVLGAAKGAVEKGAAWAAAGIVMLTTALQKSVSYLVVAVDMLREAKK